MPAREKKGERLRLRAIVVVVSTWLLFGQAALAQSCPISDTASPLLETRSATSRLSFLRSRLPEAERHATVWFASWTSTYSVLALGQSAVLPFTNETKLHRTFSINAASAALGVLFNVATPPRLLNVRARLRKQMAAEDDPCAVLSYLEQRLRLASRREKRGKSWLLHGGNVLFNAGVGLALGVLWSYWEYAFYTRMAGILLGEIMIWTKPTDATKLLSDYETARWSSYPERPSRGVVIIPWASAQGAGMTLSLDL